MKTFFKNHKKASILGLALIVLIGIFTFGTGTQGASEYTTVTKGDLIRTVELAGKVAPIEDTALSFEVAGTVTGVYKKVGDTVKQGDVLVTLDPSGTQADLLKAQADLAAARAELQKLQGGTGLEAKVTNSQTSVIQNIVQAYTQTDDAIYSKIDQFFKDPRTANPEIIFAFNDYALRNKINASRVVIGTMLAEWKKMVENLTPATYTKTDLERSKQYLADVTAFLYDVARAVNSFDTNTVITQTIIDKYKTDTATARQNVNTASAALISSGGGLTDTVSDAVVQVARVASAQATVENYRTRLTKMTLRAPISGIVSKQEAKVGEVVSPNIIQTAVISTDTKIEAYVPEVSIAGVSVGARAQVTLDAYGSDVSFDASIIRIDPRETIRDGVSTYKIELIFAQSDERIRSGMTANISVETLRKEGTLMIPSRAILKTGTRTTVLIQNGDNSSVEKEITVGVSDTKGNTEVVSGLSENDSILLNPKK